ncbi:tyrosine--tRNA ligase [Nitriliruptor alkaliphilus]|uniref:tyrosine--tRNA ligase n=1 Tax=Nitriliruptor alkaliphilus TaxID=427918 RepID=UPI0012EEB6D6|nr:tyrosine--tRNA ligase [Nitriliruptor alkaliphilus]
MSADQNPIDVLRARGFVQDVTDEAALRRRFDEGPVTYYVGFDPTAPSLHAGNLVGMMAMSWLQRLGHRPIALAGGATGRIGDPSGRDKEREVLDEATLESNLAGIRTQLGAVLDLNAADEDDPAKGLLVDNHDWFGPKTFLEVLREVGVHVPVSQMLGRESVRRRLESSHGGLTFAEFSYQLLQAYDFAHLHVTYGCGLQGGGSDQWGNITAGTDLTRRLHGAEVHGIVWPLLLTADGQKFGKSAGNAVWLDPDLTSPYAYFQWWLNAADADVPRFLRLFTYLPLEEIDDLAAELERDPAARAAHKVLAREATRVVHGDDGVAQAEAATAALFGGGPLRGLDDDTLAEAFEGAPSVQLPAGRLTDDGGIGLLEVLVAAGAASSNGEARRLVQQGGVRISGERVEDHDRRLTPDDLASPTTVVLQVGKKRRFLARFV